MSEDFGGEAGSEGSRGTSFRFTGLEDSNLDGVDAD